MILSSLLVLSLAACSGGQTQESAAPSSQAETAASSADTASQNADSGN